MYKLFISHSSKDIALVKRLMTLFQMGMGIAKEEIFCTSLTGTLETGKPYIEKTRNVVTKCDAVIFCMTEAYLESKFCIAELGAAWACNQQIFPLLGPGMTEHAFANTPLDKVQCLHMDRESDLRQLGDDFQRLGLAKVFIAQYGAEVERFLAEEHLQEKGTLNRFAEKKQSMIEEIDMAMLEKRARNDVKARFLAGVMYIEGILVPKDFKKGNDLLEWAVEQDYHPAIAFLAKQCRQGVCDSYEWEHVFERLARSEACEEASISMELGHAYRLGLGCEMDIEKALAYYEKSAAQGMLEAYEEAGDIHQKKGKIEDAIRCYVQCMKEGSPSAAYKLGLLYQDGWSEGASLNQAIYCLNVAAQSGMPEAKFQLGELYFIEHGLLRRNFVLASQYYLSAAEAGHGIAMERIGYCYQYGFGVTQDTCLAKDWYEKSAKKGYGKASLQLADLLAEERMYVEALPWYEKACKQGIPEAYRKIGDCYLYGIGVERNRAAAIENYKAAARQKEAVAILKLQDLE